MAQFGSALALGARCRRFESCLPDSQKPSSQLGFHYSHNTTGPETRSGVLEYHEGNWPENPWVSGAYSTIYTPGTWTQFGKHLRQPVGRIFWAGTEVSTAWPGYIHGALQAGEESAAAVTAVL